MHGRSHALAVFWIGRGKMCDGPLDDFATFNLSQLLTYIGNQARPGVVLHKPIEVASLNKVIVFRALGRFIVARAAGQLNVRRAPLACCHGSVKLLGS